MMFLLTWNQNKNWKVFPPFLIIRICISTYRNSDGKSPKKIAISFSSHLSFPLLRPRSVYLFLCFSKLRTLGYLSLEHACMPASPSQTLRATNQISLRQKALCAQWLQRARERERKRFKRTGKNKRRGTETEGQNNWKKCYHSALESWPKETIRQTEKQGNGNAWNIRLAATFLFFFPKMKLCVLPLWADKIDWWIQQDSTDLKSKLGQFCQPTVRDFPKIKEEQHWLVQKHAGGKDD
jgi:hypothetical protein